MSDRDFATETIRVRARRRCIRAASKTWKQLKRTFAERPIAVAASLCEPPGQPKVKEKKNVAHSATATAAASLV